MWNSVQSSSGAVDCRLLPRGACAFVALFLAGDVWAQEASYQPESTSEPAPAFRSPLGYLQVNTGLTYTDNVFQTPENKMGEALASVGFDVDYAHKGGKFDFDSRGGIKWVEYLEHAYNGVASGALNAKALFGNSNDLLQWAAWETFGQLDTDPLAAPTPVNTENVNYFTTGPILNFVFGSGDRLSLRGLYSNSTYQKSPYDSNSLDVGASLSHAVSASSSVALDVDSRRTEFKDQLIAADYDVRSAFLGYTAGITRTRFNAEVGYSLLQYRGSSSGSPLLSLGLDRRVSSSSTIYVQAQTGYSVDAESIRSAAALTAQSAAFAGASSPNPFKQENVSLGWSLNRPRTAVSLLSSVNRQRYQRQAALDQNTISLQAEVLYRLRPTLSATLSVQRANQKYRNLSAHITQTSLIAGISKTFTRSGISFRYERFHRGGASYVNEMVGVYDENRAGVYITYDLFGRLAKPNNRWGN